MRCRPRQLLRLQATVRRALAALAFWEFRDVRLCLRGLDRLPQGAAGRLTHIRLTWTSRQHLILECLPSLGRKEVADPNLGCGVSGFPTGGSHAILLLRDASDAAHLLEGMDRSRATAALLSSLPDS